MEVFLALHRLKGEISLKTIHTVNQEVINLTIQLLADLTIDQRDVSHPANKTLHKTISKRHPRWSVSIQPTIVLTNCLTFVR